MITKETIDEFFENLRSGNEFDASEVLLWSYFFLDSDLSKLKKASKKLANEGYKYVDIFEAEKENRSDKQECYLQVEKIEHHTAESLYERNAELYEFASANKICDYDGFDVGNIISSENIVK